MPSDIVVYKIDYETGYEIAKEVCDAIFTRSTTTEDRLSLEIYQEGNFWTTLDTQAFIQPKLIQNMDDKMETGVVFEVNVITPDFPVDIANRFFSELGRVAEEKGIQKIHFKNITY